MVVLELLDDSVLPHPVDQDSDGEGDALPSERQRETSRNPGNPDRQRKKEMVVVVERVIPKEGKNM